MSRVRIPVAIPAAVFPQIAIEREVVKEEADKLTTLLLYTLFNHTSYPKFI